MNIEDPVVPLERNVYGHPLAGLLWERQFDEVFVGTWMGKSAKLGMSFLFIESRDYSFQDLWTTQKLLERNSILLPCGRN